MRIWLAHSLQVHSPPPLLVRRTRHSHAVPAIHLHRCTVRRDMMTMIETKTNDTMQTTENTMDDASEYVSARACRSHVPRRMRTHDAKHLSRSQQNKNPSNTPPMAMERTPF